MLLTEEYRKLNVDLHASKPDFGTSGHRWAMEANRLALETKAQTLLDYGCGKGTFAEKIARIVFTDQDGRVGPCPYRVFEYDPAIPGKDVKPERADLLFCGDVLEHIEPTCLYAVLDDIAAIAQMMVFLVVATGPAQRSLPDGRNAHLIVEPGAWWLPKLAQRWRVDHYTEQKNGFIMIGLPK